MSGSALILRADALRLPLPDESVDLIVSSPPYFALRSYRDGDEHYSGQIGSEPTPQAFLEALWAVMHECWRVLKPTGSCFINLGDKRAGSGGHNNSGISAAGTNRGQRVCLDCGFSGRELRCSRCEGKTDWAEEVKTERRATLRNAPDRYNQAAFGRAKSKMLLPHRFAIGCEDGMADPEGKGWIMRSDIVWQKLNGLPESVTDRCRDSHEYLFHFTKEGRYFAAVDEVREPTTWGREVNPEWTATRQKRTNGTTAGVAGQPPLGKGGLMGSNPLGKLPGSVWPLASEPLITPDWRVVRRGRTEQWFFSEREAIGHMRSIGVRHGRPSLRKEVPHFAAFPTELVRRVILGWSPSGVCVECGEGRRPVVVKTAHGEPRGQTASDKYQRVRSAISGGPPSRTDVEATITGYACRCGIPAPPTRPSVVLDVFGGTGTTAGVARALGRIGVSVDLSMDYSRLADWRVHRSGHFAKVVNRTNREAQGTMFGVPA